MAEDIHWETLDKSSNIVSIAEECNKCKDKKAKFTYFKVQQEKAMVTFLCEECVEPFVTKPETEEAEGLAPIRSELAKSFIESGELSRIGDTSMETKIYHEAIDDKGVEGDIRSSAGITAEEREELEEKEDKPDQEEEEEKVTTEKKTGPPEWLNNVMDASFSKEDARGIAEDTSLSLESKQTWFKYIQTSLGDTNPYIKINLIKIFQELYPKAGNSMPEEYFEIIDEYTSSGEEDHRRMAAVALSKIGGNKSVQMLNQMLSSESEKGVKRTIEHGLKMLKK